MSSVSGPWRVQLVKPRHEEDLARHPVTGAQHIDHDRLATGHEGNDDVADPVLHQQVVKDSVPPITGMWRSDSGTRGSSSM